MDIELLKEKFWDWYFQHRDDDLDISDFLKSAFLAGTEAAQHRVQADGAYACACEDTATPDALCPTCHTRATPRQ